jgi:Zn-dependent protease
VFGARLTLFKLFGFAVRADMSWFIVVVLVITSLSTEAFPRLYAGLTPIVYWLMGIVGAIILFLSIVTHEFAHALIARRYGIPMRGITLFVFGGVAEMDDEPPSAKAELLMSLAGPATSLLLGAVFLAGYAAAVFMNAPLSVAGVVGFIGSTNVMLALFNLIPAFPLDGGRVLRSLLWMRSGNVRRATRRASQTGSALGLILVFGGIVQAFTGNFIGGLWWFLIGMFIRNAALMSYQQVVLREALQGEPVRRFMKPDPVTVPRALSVEELVTDYVYRYHHKLYPVVDDGRMVGCVTTRNIRDVPRDEWNRTTVGAIASACSEANTISPDSDVLEALRRMNQNRSSRLIVVSGERPVGILSLQDLLRFLSVKIELEEAR